MHAAALAAYRMAGVTHVVVFAPEEPFAPNECLAADGTVYPIERALAERPLPLSDRCRCVLAPLYPEPPPSFASQERWERYKNTLAMELERLGGLPLLLAVVVGALFVLLALVILLRLTGS